jgi:hypothetical protein
MADRRGVRASNRRTTPAPQPPSAAPTPQPERAPRKRGARSASRDIASVAAAAKPARRNTRKTSVVIEGDQEEQLTRKIKQKTQKQKQLVGG